MMELHIKKPDGSWTQLDMPSGSFAYNFQNSSINNVDQRKANYSQNIKLPMTERNRRFFEYVENADRDSYIPYTMLDARVYDGPYTIVGPGGVFSLLKITDSYECQVLSGSATFFEAAKEKNTIDMDLGEINRSISSINQQNELWFWPIASCLSKRARAIEGNSLDSMRIDRSIPCVNLVKLSEVLLTNLGYTQQIRSVTDLTPYAMSLKSMKLPESSYTDYNGIAKSAYSSSALSPWTVVENASGRLFYDAGNYGVVYVSPIDGILKINIRVTTPTQNPNSDLVGLSVVSYVNGQFTVPFQNTGFGYSETVEVPVIGKPDPNNHGGTFIVIRFATGIGPENSDIECFVEVQLTDGNSGGEVPTDENIILAENIGFDTVFDFVKFFCNVFGLLVSVDESSKAVTYYNYGTLDKTKAKDWSDKMSALSNPEKSYSNSNYAQLNTLTMEENKSDVITDSASFSIANTNLNKSKDFLKLTCEAGYNTTIDLKVMPSGQRLDLLVASIPVYHASNVGEDIAYNNDLKCHIVKVEGQHSVSWINTKGSSASITALSKLIVNVSSQEIIDNFYYTFINNILNNYFACIESLKLNSEDIQNYTDTDVIYLEEYGKYFYVNKIQNYQAKALTKTELIQL